MSPAAASWPGGRGGGQRHIKIKKEMTKAKRRDKRQKREGMKKMARASHFHVMKESNRLGLEVGSGHHSELFGVFVWLKVGR